MIVKWCKFIKSSLHVPKTMYHNLMQFSIFSYLQQHTFNSKIKHYLPNCPLSHLTLTIADITNENFITIYSQL